MRRENADDSIRRMDRYVEAGEDQGLTVYTMRRACSLPPLLPQPGVDELTGVPSTPVLLQRRHSGAVPGTPQASVPDPLPLPSEVLHEMERMRLKGAYEILLNYTLGLPDDVSPLAMLKRSKAAFWPKLKGGVTPRTTSSTNWLVQACCAFCPIVTR